jgi:hypothetical protein
MDIGDDPDDGIDEALELIQGSEWDHHRRARRTRRCRV